MRAKAVSAIAVCALVLALIGSPALAQGSQGGYGYDGVNIRTGAATSYTSIGLGYIPDGLCLFYLLQGETINGESWWGNHTNGTTGVGPGFSNMFYLYYSPGVSC